MSLKDAPRGRPNFEVDYLRNGKGMHTTTNKSEFGQA